MGRARFARVAASLTFAALLPIVALAAEPYRATSSHPFDDVARWKKVFDDPGRDEWQKPGEVVAALEIEAGASVADLGSGTGFFLPHLSRAVGATGVVFAVDVEPNLVVHLRERAESERLRNVIPVLASFDDPRLPPKSLDLVLVVDTFHHLDHRLEYLRRLREALGPAGRVAIVDWKAGDLPKGPPTDHKLGRDQVAKEMTEAGYRLVAEPDLLPYQYFLIFE